MTLSLFLASALTLVSSVLYATRGWDDGAAALVHILGGALGSLVVVRVVTYLDRAPLLAAIALAVGMLGSAGVVGYGFNTIGVGLGGVDLIDATGAATIIKPLGLAWPLALLLLGVGLLLAHRVPLVCSLGIAVAAVLFPVSRIGNIAWLAVAVDAILLVGLVAIPFVLRDEPADAADSRGLTPSVAHR